MLTVRLILTIAKLHKLDSKAIDFVLAFLQADLEEDIWMQLPICFQVDGQTEADSDRQYVLKLNKNLYGLKQGSYNWYEKLKKSLMDRGFKPSDIDPCLYIGKGMIVLTYVDDCIIVGPSMTDIDYFVTSMKYGSENFVLTDEGDINKFLGIEITQLDDKRFKISQPFLIDRILSFLNIDTNEYGMDTNAKSTPVGKPLLHKDLSGNRAKKHGTTARRLACSRICKATADQRCPWLFIKQHTLATALCFHTRRPSNYLADIFTTLKRKVSYTTQTPQKVSNVMWMQISRAGGKKLTLTTLKT